MKNNNIKEMINFKYLIIIIVSILIIVVFYYSNNFINTNNEVSGINKVQENHIEVDNLKEINDENDYQKAINYFTTGSITNAKNIFEQLGDYKDSKLYLDKISVLNNLIGDFKFKNMYIIIENSNTMFVSDENGYANKYSFNYNYDTNTIKFKDTNINISQDYNTIKYNGNTYLRTNDTINIKYETPKVGMSKDEVLNSSWGPPNSIDHGGTVANKNNKKRTNGEWDEAWYYRRNGDNIFIYFKNNKVVKFTASSKKKNISGEVSSLDGF